MSSVDGRIAKTTTGIRTNTLCVAQQQPPRCNVVMVVFITCGGDARGGAPVILLSDRREVNGLRGGLRSRWPRTCGGGRGGFPSPLPPSDATEKTMSRTGSVRCVRFSGGGG